MQPKRRWMTNVTREAAKSKIEMPWARGPRREAMIARRKSAEPKQASRPGRA